MNRTCVVVVDAARARLYRVEPDSDRKSGFRLVEKADLTDTDYLARGANAPRVKSERNTSRQAGPMHPYGEKRKQHREEVKRKFARDVANAAKGVVRAWTRGRVVLISETRMLGVMREPLGEALKSGIEVKELKKDYTRFTLAAIERRLERSGLLRPA